MSRRAGTDYVEPDLPITPMLDMSFQLLSFFIMTFHPSPTEGQIALTLPPSESPGGNERILELQEKPTQYIVQIQAADQGTITGITLREEGAPGDRDLGSDANILLKELKVIAAAETRRREVGIARGVKIPPPRITIEIGDKLLQASVIQVFDASVQAGFADIATVPIDKNKR